MQTLESIIYISYDIDGETNFNREQVVINERNNDDRYNVNWLRMWILLTGQS